MSDGIEARLRTHGRYGLAWEAADHIAQLEAFIWEQTEALHNWWGDGSFRTAADDILFVEPSEWFAKYGTDPDQHPSWCPVIEREPCICGRSLFPETPPA